MLRICQSIIFFPLSSTGNIYWTDQGFDVIEVARLNGSFRYVVISQGLDKPRAITVHPAKGWEETTLGLAPITTVASVSFCFCNFSHYWLLRNLSRCLVVCVVCVCIATCSGQSGASIPVLSGLVWMALRGLSWSMPVSAGPTVSPLIMRYSITDHYCIYITMLLCRQWTLRHNITSTINACVHVGESAVLVWRQDG